jgi:hypothetical protein
MRESRQLEELRQELAGIVCIAQSLPVPRSSFQKMMCHLLWTAFASLDEDSGVDPARAVTIATLALREWRAFAPLLGSPR